MSVMVKRVQALLADAEAPQEEESFNYSGAIGASVAVLGAAAALIAARRCSKRDESDFERALL